MFESGEAPGCRMLTGGSHPSWLKNSTISNVPTRNSGSELIASEVTDIVVSRALPAFKPAAKPRTSTSGTYKSIVAAASTAE